MIDVRLLGAVSADRDGQSVSLGGRGPTTLLALLALNPGEVVAIDRIIDAVWEGDPPATAVNTVQVYVSRLRRALGESEAVLTRRPGYLLSLDRASVDALRFEDEVMQARRDLEEGSAGVAAARLSEALKWWRGPVADGLSPASFLEGFRSRMDEAKWAARQLLARAELARGRHRELVEQLAGWVADAPAREDLWASLMLALYRSGRQADALEAFRRARTYLVEELGLDPGSELQALEDAILRQDPSLDGPQPPQSAPTTRPLVGRAGFLNAIDDTIRIVEQGRSVVLCFAGRAGVGLGRLATECTLRAQAEGLTVASALAYPDSGLLPGEVARQLGLGEGQPDVIVVEHGHHADGTSLGRLLRLVAARPTLVVVTAEPSLSKPLRTFRRRASSVAVVLDLTVDPLTTVDLESITDTEAASALINITGGLPRRLFPLIDDLVATEEATWHGTRLEVTLPIAATPDSPAGDTRHLEGVERRLVEAAALASRALELKEIAHLVEADTDVALDIVDRLTERGYLEQSPAGVAASAAVDVGTLKPLRTTELYGHLADGAKAAGLSTGLVGTYLARARRYDEAIPMLTEAGWEALGGGSEGEAFELLSTAHDACEDMVEIDLRTAGRIELGLAQCLRLDGASEEAAQHLDRAVSVLDGDLRIDALGFAAQVADDRQNPSEADRFLTLALREAQGAQRGSLLTLHSRVMARLGRPEQSAQFLEEGLELLEKDSGAKQEYFSAYNRAWLAVDQARMPDAAVLFERLLTDEKREGRRADLLAWWARALLGSGHPDRGHAAASEAIELGRRVGLEGPVYMGTLALAEALPAYGQLDEGVAAGRRLLGIVLHQLPAWENAARALLARALLAAGEEEAARSEADLAVELSPPGGRRWQLTALAVSSMAGQSRVDLPELAEEAATAGWSGIAAELHAADAMCRGRSESAERAAAIGLETGHTLSIIRGLAYGATSVPAKQAVCAVDEFIPAGWRRAWRATGARSRAEEA